MFNNELDLLEIRLNHHSDFVDKFILTESTFTYSGKPKRLYYNEVKDKEPFSKFKDKIIYNIFDLEPNGFKNWEYEKLQRNSLCDFLYLFTHDDIILYLDCDELVRNKNVINTSKNIDNIVSLDMTLNWYYFNCVIDPTSEFQNDYSMEECFNRRWHMGKIVRKNHLIDFSTNLYAIREHNIWSPENNFTIPNAGWHFSNLGKGESIYNKLNSFSHSDELNSKYKITPELIEERKRNLQDPLGRKVKFIKIELDVPKYIMNNIEKYKDYIL
jgi:beta-1,4-mannosyl-glycoprotein beta-1,4-N-acetylglucosaminyltransferase